jgi:hypothetical protein
MVNLPVVHCMLEISKVSYLSHGSLIFFAHRSTPPPPLSAMVCGAGRFEMVDVLLCRSNRRGGSRRSRTGGRRGGSGGEKGRPSSVVRREWRDGVILPFFLFFQTAIEDAWFAHL